MTFKCIFGYEEDKNFICSHDKQLCECPVGMRCRIFEKSKDEAATLYNILNDIFSGKKLDDEMKKQINWDYMSHMDIRE